MYICSDVKMTLLQLVIWSFGYLMRWGAERLVRESGGSGHLQWPSSRTKKVRRLHVWRDTPFWLIYGDLIYFTLTFTLSLYSSLPICRIDIMSKSFIFAIFRLGTEIKPLYWLNTRAKPRCIEREHSAIFGIFLLLAKKHHWHEKTIG